MNRGYFTERCRVLPFLVRFGQNLLFKILASVAKLGKSTLHCPWIVREVVLTFFFLKFGPLFFMAIFGFLMRRFEWFFWWILEVQIFDLLVSEILSRIFQTFSRWIFQIISRWIFHQVFSGVSVLVIPAIPVSLRVGGGT